MHVTYGETLFYSTYYTCVFAKSVFLVSYLICQHDILLLLIVSCTFHNSGTACSNAGMAHSFNFEPSSLLPATIEYLRPELTRKVADLTQNLSK